MPMTLDDVPLLVRREIEARILKPFVDALGQRFDREEVLSILSSVIQSLAEQAGKEFAQRVPKNDLAGMADVLNVWSDQGGIDIDLLKNEGGNLEFDVTRCRYAELYERLGMGDLGTILSCNRDGCFAAGFNPDITLERTRTIMENASHCDFRFKKNTETSKEEK